MTILSTLASIVLLVVAIAVLCADQTTAFINKAPSPIHRCNQFLTTMSLSSSSGEDYTASEVHEMDSLIISLSLEPTDDSRRQRLAQVFATELAKADCTSRRFADLFDQVLATVGDRIQLAARKKALKAQQERNQLQESQESDNETEELEDEDRDFMGVKKSPEERQLWALVDMMVQSKTLSKKAFGQLGNKGTMQ